MSKCLSVMLAIFIPLSGWVLFVEASAGQPTKEQIAFLRLSSDFWQVWAMEADGSAQKQLTSSPVDKVHIAPRPGTNELLYHTSQGETFLLNLKTGAEKQFLDGISTMNAVWDPKGKRLAYETAPKDEMFAESSVWVSDPSGSNRQKVADKILWKAAPAWLNDKLLLYTRARLLPSYEMNHEFWILDLVSSSDRRLDKGQSEPKKFDAVAFGGNDKSLIAYTSLKSGFYEIWILDRAEGEPKQLTGLESYSGNPSWSGNGEFIVFESLAKEKLHVYQIAIDGSDLKQLTHGETPSRKPVWIPFTSKGE